MPLLGWRVTTAANFRSCRRTCLRHKFVIAAHAILMSARPPLRRGHLGIRLGLLVLRISPAGMSLRKLREERAPGPGSPFVRIGLGNKVKHPAFHGLLVGRIILALILNFCSSCICACLVRCPRVGNHLGQIDIENPACCHVIEIYFPREPAHLLAAIHKSAADRNRLPMTVHGAGTRSDRAHRCRPRARRSRSGKATGRNHQAAVSPYCPRRPALAFPLRITVVGDFGDDIGISSQVVQGRYGYEQRFRGDIPISSRRGFRRP